MRRLLVTGATGCLGRAVVDEALARQWTVIGLARREPTDWPPSAKFIRGDVHDLTLVRTITKGIDNVVHLAGVPHLQSPSRSELVHGFVDSAKVVAASAQNVGARLLLMSSVAVYGSRVELVDESTPTRPDTVYGETKLEAEEVVRELNDSTIILRPCVVFGKYDRGNVARLITAVRRFGPIVLGPGDNRKSLLFAPNLARRVVRLLESHDENGVWPVSDQYAPTMNELISEIARSLGRSASPVHLPASAALFMARLADSVSRSQRWTHTVQQMMTTTVVRSRLDQRLQYTEPVDLTTAMAETVAWLVRRGIRAPS
jgi:nucleoside-diphosphate-sugar epimerase